MKKLLNLTIITTCFYMLMTTSCKKSIETMGFMHDTLYIPQVDTVSRFVLMIDTIIKPDTHQDTVIQVRHDTLIIIRTIIDTVTKIKTITETDTVIKAGYLSNYPVPAVDSEYIYIVFDTIPGLIIEKIIIENIATYVPAPIPYQGGDYYAQTNEYHPQYDDYHKWYIKVLNKMIANIKFEYSWVNPMQFQLQNFLAGPGILHTWEVTSPAGLGGSPGTIHTNQEARFDYIDLPQIFTIRIRDYHNQ